MSYSDLVNLVDSDPESVTETVAAWLPCDSHLAVHATHITTPTIEPESEPSILKKPLTELEMQRFQDLGLGMGVNIADPKPWKNRSNYQVRIVDASNIAEIDLVSAVKEYETEVASTFSTQLQTGSVFDPPYSNISVGIDVELSRSVSKSYKIKGIRIDTRKIAYKVEKDGLNPFQERMIDWVLRRRRKIGELTVEIVLEKFKNDPNAIKEYESDFDAFIKEICVTHYISAIRLGALTYQAYTEEEYQAAVKSGSDWGADGVQNSKIGHIRRDGSGELIVRRGTADEAVIGIEMLPISTLITIPDLQSMIVRLTKQLFGNSQNYSYGPFYIGSNDKSLFLTVRKDNRVFAVKFPETLATNEPRPSLFYILSTDNPAQPHQFSIMYIPEEDNEKGEERKTIQSIPQYLTVSTNWRGYCRGPLKLKSDARSSNATFTLASRTRKVSSGVSIAPWTSHHDAFFIRCITKRFQRHSYLAVVRQCDPTTKNRKKRNKKSLCRAIRDLWVKRKKKTEADPWVLRCMPSKAQEDRDDVFMLFRIFPREYKHEDFSTVPARETTARDTIQHCITLV